MSTMVTEVYEALIEAGASQEKAKKAAEVLSYGQLATKDDVKALRRDTIVGLGFVIAVMSAGFGYVVNAINNNATLINTIISKSG